MGQIARVVEPSYPHHITQRRSRRQRTFFCEEDYRAFLDLMSEWCSKHEVDIRAYCLMPNHAHLISSGLDASIGTRIREGVHPTRQKPGPAKKSKGN
jgi:REP element-mobilizing transposase RayT